MYRYRENLKKCEYHLKQASELGQSHIVIHCEHVLLNVAKNKMKRANEYWNTYVEPMKSQSMSLTVLKTVMTAYMHSKNKRWEKATQLFAKITEDVPSFEVRLFLFCLCVYGVRCASVCVDRTVHRTARCV